MAKRVIGAGLAGGVTLIAWTFVVNGILGFQTRIDMKPIAAEREVYEVLKQNIVSPGRFVANPAPTSAGRFPDNEPVFSILYGGVGHESAGGLALIGLAAFLVAPMIVAWMLSQASDEVLSSYPRRVLFCAAIGVLLAVLSDLPSFGIGEYPLGDAVLLAANHVVAWTLVGVVLATRLGPRGETGSAKTREEGGHSRLDA